MLALTSAAGHSGRSLTTTYETIPYYIHCTSSCRWLDDIMRQQEGVHDDHAVVQLNGCDYEEGHDEEGANDQEKDLDQEEDRCFFSGSFAFPYSVTVRFAAPGRRAQQFGEST
jgi:hypothetical protein